MAKSSNGTSETPADECHVFKLGPVYVGKGLSGKMLKARFGHHVHQIIIGDLVRSRLEDDLEFAKEFGLMLSNRDLLPDPVVTPMARACYEAGRSTGCSLFEWDGFGRTGMQIESLIKWGFLNPLNTRCLILEADDETCWQRYLHSLENKTRKHRNDVSNANFKKAMALYKWHRPFVLEALETAGVKPVFIDANQELETVANLVVGHALELHYPLGWPKSAPRQKTSDLVTPESVGFWTHLKGLRQTAF
ncbi:MAG: nucleoside monophosphate kinase [Patescibacteria group bacterium]